MRRNFLAVAVIVVVSTSVLLTDITLDVEATSERKSSIGDYVLIVDDEGQPRPIDRLEATVDEANRSVATTVQDSDPAPFWLYVRKGWLESIAQEPAFANRSFTMKSHNGTQWFGIRITNPTGENAIGIRDFRPEVGRAQYTFGSRRSILLERPMFVSLSEIPGVRWEQRLRENRNGTWWERVPVGMTRLGINLTDANTSGQTVTLRRDWLGTFGLGKPYFQYADGRPMENSSDESHFYLRPRHFSILYVFTTSESFWKEDDGVYSNVFWDSTNRNIYVLSDRRDPLGTDERMRSTSSVSVTYDETTSFTVRATWKTTQQGHWQRAVPLFFMGASNPQVHFANSVYVLYTSRASGSQSPRYYLRYVDGGGTLRIDSWVDAPVNVQLEFSLQYDAVARTFTLGIYDSTGYALRTVSLSLGANEAFALGKVGAGAWGDSDTSEAATIASVDNILVDANVVRNGGFELDTNADGTPDYWQAWPGSQGSGARSSTRARSGVYSFRIDDSSSSLSYGLQTLRISAAPSQSFVASVWVFVETGHVDLYLEFFNAPSGGTRIGVAAKSTTVAGEWEFLDLTMMAPTGTASVDVLVYSSLGNTGTAYFDGADLRRSRSFWATEVHTNHLPLPSDWRQAIDYVTDLGMTSVRIDFVWAYFEPDQDVMGWDHIAYWDSVISILRARGVGVTAILSAPFPPWTEFLLDDVFFSEWRGFASFVASRYGNDIRYYQILNEENHPLHSKFPHTHEGEVRAFHEAYEGLLEGTGLTASEHKSRFKTIVNLWADDGGGDWNTLFRDILNDPWGDDSIDVVAVDHYPGTWCCGSNYRDWGAFDTLSQIARDYGKEMAIIETGFSSWTWPNGQQDQERFVNEAMGEVWTRAVTNNRDHPLNSLVLVSWYELIDADSNGGPNPEVHFGVLTSSPPWAQKLAYDDLRYQVTRWT